MNRETLKKIVTVTLMSQFRDRQAAEKAEAIAAQLDIFATVMGDGAASAAPAPFTQFPPVSPGAVEPSAVIPPVDRQEPDEAPYYNPHDPANLVVPADSATGQKLSAASDPPAPVRSVRQAPGKKAPGGKISVTELNQLIQDNTPRRISIDVPMEGGGTRRAILDRDVVSRHVEESVQLIYFPPGTSQSQREYCQIQSVISVEDTPVNLQAVMEKIKQDAVRALSPKGDIISVPPRVKLGAVQPTTDYGDGSPASVKGTDLEGSQAAFNSLPPVAL